MNISYNWLRELTNATLAPRELAERLTMVGLAVDAVHETGDDFVLEFDITSNRPDCLSHLGVGRETAVLINGSVRLPEAESPHRETRHAENPVSSKGFAMVEVRDLELCPRYAARVVRGVRIAASPDWMIKRLQAIGQRPINNVTDITNYVLHEQGQPLHAFDLAKLTEQRIVVRRALEGERIRTLDEVERSLSTQMLVIADAVRPVAVAGVMGGEETEITSATTDVLIESAYFDPQQVRRTAQTLNLHTDASHRFERGVDFEGVLRAQARAVSLICETAGGSAEDAIDVYPKPIEPRVVRLRFKRIKELTGLDVVPEDALRILTALGLVAMPDQTHQNRLKGSDPLSLTRFFRQEAGANPVREMIFVAPTWRVDIEREEDLIEEIARHVGYDKVESELPASSVAGEYQPHERRRRAARRALAGCGFDEAISFSFIEASHDKRFETLFNLRKTGEGGSDAGFVSLRNPIIEGAMRMRPTLLPGLLDAVRTNFNHGTRNVRLFEMARVFAANAQAGELPEEAEALALVVTGGEIVEGRSGHQRELDFFDLKGALEMAADAMNIESLEFEAAAAAGHLREGQAAKVLVGGQTVGMCGRLAEATAAVYKFRQAVYVAEVNLSLLLEVKERSVRYMPLARYPSVVRDLSLIVDRRITFDELRQATLDLQIEDCRSVTLVDVYEGGGVPEEKRSLTLRIEYRSDERTLRDEDVDESHARVVGELETRFGARQRQ